MWGASKPEAAGVYVFCLLCSCFWSLKMNFCESVIATWFSDMPSLVIPRTIIPLYSRLLKFSTSSSPWPWMTKFMKETVRFHFGTQMKPEKCARDDNGHMVLKNASDRIQNRHAHWFHICGDAADVPSTQSNHPHIAGSRSCTWFKERQSSLRVVLFQ